MTGTRAPGDRPEKGGERSWRVRVVEPLIAVLLGVAYVVVLLATVDDLGYARDEGFYFHAAQSYQTWFELLLRDPSAALEQRTIDRYWGVNREHPALIKTIFAASHYFLHEQWGVFHEAGTAFRFGGMLTAGLCVSILYAWGQRAAGRYAGLVAALGFAAMPRVFYHSHLACFDAPVAAVWLTTTYAYWRSTKRGSWGWVIACGLLYGCLLNTKHNSWLLPPALLAHWMLVHGRDLVGRVTRGRVPVPWGLLSMLLLGPLVFYATWPWIWHDTLERLSRYAAFHLGHDYYNMEFLGHTYWKPPMPLGYAWLMTLGTVPLILLVLSAIGVGAGAFAALRFCAFPGAGVVRRWFGWPTTRADVRALPRGGRAEARLAFREQLLWLLCILLSYAPWWLTKTPIFGGTKHWITAYPFLCLFAGLGFSSVWRGLCQSKAFGVAPRLAPAALAVVLCLGPIVMTAHSHPWGLSAYTPLVGGASGAANLGLNRTFWGYTTGALVDGINRLTPTDGRLYLHDTALPSFAMLQEDRRLRRDIRGTLDIAASDLALYHHEPHMHRVEYQIWIAYGTSVPALIATYDGVPVVWLYARPGLEELPGQP